MSRRTNVFGMNIELPVVSIVDHVEEFCIQVAKRKEEKTILLQFLREAGLSKISRLDEINREIAITEETYDENIKQRAYEYYLTKLKKARTNSGNGPSMYTYLMLEYVEKTTIGKVKEYAHKYKVTNNLGPMPMMAGHLRKAEGVVSAKIKSDIGEKHCRIFLKEKKLESRIREISQDLFYGVGAELGLEQVKVFMSVMFELRKLETAVPTNAKIMREHILRAVRGEPFELIHLKCPRYAYPKGENFDLLDHSKTCQIIEEGDKPYVIFGEEELLTRLIDLRQMFEKHGLKTLGRVLLVEQDIIDHVFEGRDMVISDGVLSKLEKYKRNLIQKLPGFEVTYLRDFLSSEKLLTGFDEKRKQILRELYAGGGTYSESFVEARVDYRSERNRQITNKERGRQYARDQVYAQLATLQALGVLRMGVEAERNYFLVEEDRGVENSYIGGVRDKALSAFFMKLRDNRVETKKIKKI